MALHSTGRNMGSVHSLCNSLSQHQNYRFNSCVKTLYALWVCCLFTVLSRTEAEDGWREVRMISKETNCRAQIKTPKLLWMNDDVGFKLGEPWSWVFLFYDRVSCHSEWLWTHYFSQTQTPGTPTSTSWIVGMYSYLTIFSIFLSLVKL